MPREGLRLVGLLVGTSKGPCSTQGWQHIGGALAAETRCASQQRQLWEAASTSASTLVQPAGCQRRGFAAQPEKVWEDSDGETVAEGSAHQQHMRQEDGSAGHRRQHPDTYGASQPQPYGRPQQQTRQHNRRPWPVATRPSQQPWHRHQQPAVPPEPPAWAGNNPQQQEWRQRPQPGHQSAGAANTMHGSSQHPWSARPREPELTASSARPWPLPRPSPDTTGQHAAGSVQSAVRGDAGMHPSSYWCAAQPRHPLQHAAPADSPPSRLQGVALKPWEVVPPVAAPDPKQPWNRPLAPLPPPQPAAAAPPSQQGWRGAEDEPSSHVPSSRPRTPAPDVSSQRGHQGQSGMRRPDGWQTEDKWRHHRAPDHGAAAGNQPHVRAAPVKPVAQPKQAPAIVISQGVTVKRLAELLHVSEGRLEEVLAELGDRFSSEEDVVPLDSAELAALELGRTVIISRAADVDKDAQPRSAVVTVMGHVDHGKTSLLDALRNTSVAAREAGGITQHIGAFTVCMPDSRASLTFLDTPGHAAFSAMRQRGAAITDLVVLVVAAEDGVMPQTREALAHARAAGCPIVVAVSKCDLPGADPPRVRQQLISEGLELEEIGGNVQVVETAATKGVGLLELEEALLLQAELMELKASQTCDAEGAVVEAKMVKGQGPVATVIVKRGTLEVGQAVVVGTEWGKVRSLKGPAGSALKRVLPGEPAEVAGLRGLPQAGDHIMVVSSEERARCMSSARSERADEYRLTRLEEAARLQQHQDEALAQEGGEGARELTVLLKADVQGSVEAVRDAIVGMSSDQVRVKVVFMGVGAVTQSDVQLAVSTGATIVAFNVKPAGAAVEAEAKAEGLRVCTHRVIYHLLEEVAEMIAGVAPRVEEEVVVGSAEVLQVFPLKGKRGEAAGQVAGCNVTDGALKGHLVYRVVRSGDVVHEGKCSSLKRHKLAVDTVGKGAQCGVLLDEFHDLQPGDLMLCIAKESRQARSSEVVQQAM